MQSEEELHLKYVNMLKEILDLLMDYGCEPWPVNADVNCNIFNATFVSALNTQTFFSPFFYCHNMFIQSKQFL